MTRGWWDGPHEPTATQHLDETVHGLRGIQHNREDRNCRVRSSLADGKGQNRCPICRPDQIGTAA